MPKRANKPCRKLGCARYAESHGYCEAHKAFASNWHSNEQRKGNRHKRGYGSAWEKLRAFILRRDFYLCQEHLRQGEHVEGNHVDHIIPKAQGGTDRYSNLQTLCASCHKLKTASESRVGGVKSQ
jgi:5-methylcytosine-specific restriction protein A